MVHDFAAEIATARSRLDAEPFLAAQDLRAIEESWARQLLGVASAGDIAAVVRRRVKAALEPTIAGEASAHLAEAEKWQEQIGRYATGAGEGLASMGALRSLQMARAWIEVTLSRAAGHEAATKRALALASEIDGDANGLGARHAKALRQLRALLSAPSDANDAPKNADSAGDGSGRLVDGETDPAKLESHRGG
jgi:hypothetical protein